MTDREQTAWVHLWYAIEDYANSKQHSWREVDGNFVGQDHHKLAIVEDTLRSAIIDYRDAVRGEG